MAFGQTKPPLQKGYALLDHLDDIHRAHFRRTSQLIRFVIAGGDLVDVFFLDAADQYALAIGAGDAPSLLVHFHTGIATDALMPVVDDLDQRC